MIAVGKLLSLVVIATGSLGHSLVNFMRNPRHLLAIAVVNPVCFVAIAIGSLGHLLAVLLSSSVRRR